MFILISPFPNWRCMVRCLVLVQFFLPAITAAAAEKPCPRAEAQGTNGKLVEFGEHAFADGSVDLVMRLHTANGVDLKRVTYGGGKAKGCRYTAVALAAGGGANQWGWHLAWASEQGVRYARMDGVAWVSSPPKRLSAGHAGGVQLQVSGTEVHLRWQAQHAGRTEIHQAVSHDEGRSWESPEQVQAAD